MNIIHKRKSTTAKSIKQTLKKLPQGQVWVYGTGKLHMVSYHEVDQLSSHMIKELADNKCSDYYLYRKYVKRDIEFKETPSLIIGRAFHTAVLEPKLYESEYAVAPKCDKRTKQGKIDYAEFLETLNGRTILTNEQDELVRKMQKAVFKNRYAKAILKGCHPEVTGFQRLDNGLVLKGRIDDINYEGNYGLDLKSVEDCSPAGFAKAAANYRYDIQAYTYKKLFGLDEFMFLCCSKDDPFEVGLYTLNDEFMTKAEDDFNFAIERWEQLINKKDEWETFSNKENPMTVLAPPKWFLYI